MEDWSLRLLQRLVSFDTIRLPHHQPWLYYEGRLARQVLGLNGETEMVRNASV